MWAALFYAPHASAAATFTVTRTDDPVPNGCLPTDCSLREAVIAVNAGSGGDAIALPPGDYRLAISGIDSAGMKGDLNLTKSVTITGVCRTFPGITIEAPASADAESRGMATRPPISPIESPDRKRGGGDNKSAS